MTPAINTSNRIKPLDGLRTVAVLGVLWTHLWGFYGNMPWRLTGIDVNRVLSFGRNGVDLFFVISGFCMYLMYHKKVGVFNADSYSNFIIQRWKRIAPAFYVLIAVEAIVILIRDNFFPIKEIFANVFFVNIFLDNKLFSPHYWSLSTEWHFYLALPFIFLQGINKKSVVRNVWILIFLSMICRGGLFYLHNQDLVSGITINSDPIWFRFPEFAFGILAAVYFLQGYRLPGFLSGLKGFFIAFGISYIGRILMLTEIAAHLDKYAFWARTIGEPTMCVGFALILYNVITTESLASKVLSSGPFQFLGKISYSFYLWHWLVSFLIAFFVKKSLGNTLLSFNVSFVCSVIVMIPVSWISYELFESLYFKKRSVSAINAKTLPST